MDDLLTPQCCIKTRDKSIFAPGKQVLVLTVALVAFPAIAEESTEQPVNYTGNYRKLSKLF